MRHLRMRTALLISLLAVSLGLTLGSLFVIRFTVQREILNSLHADLARSLQTYRNIESQRDHMLSREGALLANLPSLKALLATQDKRTISNGEPEFAAISRADFFALLAPAGDPYAYKVGANPGAGTMGKALRLCMNGHDIHCLIPMAGGLYKVSIQPIYFGPEDNHTLLGYVATGYAIDANVARELSDATAADAVFLGGGRVYATTLPAELANQIQPIAFNSGSFETTLAGERYIAATVDLPGAVAEQPQLLVLKSFDRASLVLKRVHGRLITLGITSVFLAIVLAIWIARTVTFPLELLVRGTRALGRGDFHYRMEIRGAAEVRELGLAMMRTREALKSAQHELLEAERLATIGRMASSVSHDLRHHLSAIYANAEFMSLPNTSSDERLELYLEVKDGVLGMADLVESLLIFSRTGKALQINTESLNQIVERTAHTAQRHPECRSVKIEITSSVEIALRVDAKKLERAVYNLLLNACQAAKKGSKNPKVSVAVTDQDDVVQISVFDNGVGIPDSIRHVLFQPFVSSGKENGTGLGLTLAQHIAQEHGGEVRNSREGDLTCFTIALSKSALEVLERSAAMEAPTEANVSTPHDEYHLEALL